MSGLRTRRLLALGAVAISGGLLLHLLSGRNPLEINLRLNDITSNRLPPQYHQQQHYQPYKEQVAQRPSTPEPIPDPENVLKHIQDRSSQQRQDGSRKPQEPLFPNDIPKPKTTLDPGTNYLGYLMYGGLTNQVTYLPIATKNNDNAFLNLIFFSQGVGLENNFFF